MPMLMPRRYAYTPYDVDTISIVCCRAAFAAAAILCRREVPAAAAHVTRMLILLL